MAQLIVLIIITFVGFFGFIFYTEYKDANKEVYYIAFCSDKEGKEEYGNSRTIYSTFEQADAAMYTWGWKYHVVPISKGVGQWREGNKLEEDYLVVKTKKKKDIYKNSK